MGNSDLPDRRLKATVDRPVIEPGREPSLRLHFVDQAVIAEVHFPDVHAVIQDGDEDQQRQEAPARAGAAPGARYHCDCAPSTISFTRLTSATFRPSSSRPGLYSTSTSTWRFQTVVPSRCFRISTSAASCTFRFVRVGCPCPGRSA